MTVIDPIYVGEQAPQQLANYAATSGLQHATLIADERTYAALGSSVEAALSSAGVEVAQLIMPGDEVIADERTLMRVFVHAPLHPTTFVAVGSGTITDITRFTSHRMGRKFISVPTAASVDGFTSIGAPLVINRVKQTINCQAPTALFADLDTLSSAPRELTAAGYGDMIGKFTSLADWHLVAILWHEPYDTACAARTNAAVDQCVAATEAVSRQSNEGLRELTHALIDSGLSMLDFGSSQPASGSEHHASHYWEMMLLQQNRPAVLHGAKVGFALSNIAKHYARLRTLNRADVEKRLAAASLPDQDAEIDIIRRAYGPVADDVIAGHGPFLNMTAEDYDAIKARVAAHWDDVLAIAATVPEPVKIRDLLQAVGAPVTGAPLGLADDEVTRGFEYGHYLRNRFTVLKLSRMLGLPLDPNG